MCYYASTLHDSRMALQLRIHALSITAPPCGSAHHPSLRLHKRAGIFHVEDGQPGRQENGPLFPQINQSTNPACTSEFCHHCRTGELTHLWHPFYCYASAGSRKPPGISVTITCQNLGWPTIHVSTLPSLSKVKRSCLCSTCNLQLLEDGAQIIPYGFVAQTKIDPDLLVGFPQGHQLQHSQFLR